LNTKPSAKIFSSAIVNNFLVRLSLLNQLLTSKAKFVIGFVVRTGFEPYPLYQCGAPI
jgi:hypothetical protein